MARMPAEKQDARDRAQTLIRLELRRYSRRLAQSAEDHISMAYDKAAAAGLPFDYKQAAQEAVESAQSMYMQKAIEADATPGPTS